jgi:hypothetical protein
VPSTGCLGWGLPKNTPRLDFLEALFEQCVNSLIIFPCHKEWTKIKTFIKQYRVSLEFNNHTPAIPITNPGSIIPRHQP